VQGHHLKVNCTKGAPLFANYFSSHFSAFITLQLLFQVPYFGTFLPNAVANKILKIICAKAALL
jgi:hypothetical protein